MWASRARASNAIHRKGPIVDVLSEVVAAFDATLKTPTSEMTATMSLLRFRDDRWGAIRGPGSARVAELTPSMIHRGLLHR